MSDKYERIAIVTGATSGIGEATARKFVAAGFGVVGNGRNAAKLAALEKELGSAFCGAAGDASDNTVLERIFASAQERFGKTPDIVVVNAGRGLAGSVTDADLSQFNDVLRINVGAALALSAKSGAENGGDPAKGLSPNRQQISSSSDRSLGGTYRRSARSMAPPNMPCMRWRKDCDGK